MDVENKPLSKKSRMDMAFPQYVLNNTEATLSDMPPMDFTRTVLALKAAFVIMYAEIGVIIIDGIIDMRERESRDDTSSLMQTGMIGASGDGKQGGNEDEERPPWRPRKCPKNNRRRRLIRRRVPG